MTAEYVHLKLRNETVLTRLDDAIAPGSSRGPSVGGRRKPDIAAPGSGVIAAGANVPNTGIFSVNYNWTAPAASLFVSMTGTSMAAPHIAGSLALLQNRPEANLALDGCPAGTPVVRPLAVKALLLNSASSVSSTPGVAAANPPGMNPGWNADAGWGYADLSRTFTRLYVFNSCVTPAPVPEHARFYVGNVQVPNNELFRATVVWNRHIASWQKAAAIANADIVSNLSLTLYDYNLNQPISSANSGLAGENANNNVRQLTSAAIGMRVIKVRGENGFDPTIADEQFALAVSQNGFTRAEGPQLAVNCTYLPAGEVLPGSTVKISCTVQNAGDLPVFNVVTGMSLVPASQNQNWPAAMPNQSETYNWTVAIPSNAAGEYPFTASANGTAFGENFSVLNPYVIDIVTPLSISCGAVPSILVPAGGDFLVKCSVANSGDVPAMNTTVSLSSGAIIASRNIGKVEKLSVPVGFDPISNIYHVMTGTVTWTIAGQPFSINTNVAIDPCTSYYGVNPAGAFIPVGGTLAASANFIAPAGCSWTAANSTMSLDVDEWIQFTSSGSGSGNGSVAYKVLPNTGPVRTGRISIGQASFVVTQAGTPVPTYTVSGRVTAPDGTGIYGVSIAGSSTDVNGYWTADLLSGRTTKVVPRLSRYSFTPSFLAVSGSASNINFTGSFSFGVSGRIIDFNGNPVPGAKLTFTRQSGAAAIPAAVVTDAQGNWHQTGFQTGTVYVVTPSASGYAFAPETRTVTDGAIGIDFTGLQQTAVSGRVVSSTTGVGIPGVTMTFLLVSGSTVVPASVQTDASGNYSQTGFVAGTAYLVTASKAGFTFTPSSLAFTGSSSNLNFSGAPIPFSISGRVTDSSGNGSTGVTLTFVRLTSTGGASASVQTDAQGNYSQSNFDTGSSYMVSPSKAGFVFTPVSRSFIDGSTPLNFTIGQPLTVSGKIVDGNGNGLPGVTLTFAPGSGSATPPAPVQTDASGNWAQTGFLPGQIWVVTASKSGDVFIPPSATFSGNTPNLAFTGYVPANVSGQLVNTNGVPVGGATLTFSPANKQLTTPANVQTDSTGHWSQTGFATGVSYTVTFSLTGITLSPASSSFAAGASPITLTTTATFTASGVVTASQGNGYPNITVTFTSASTAPPPVVTNSSGAWSQSGFLLGTVYQAQAYKVGCGTPPAQSFSSPSTTLNFAIIVCNR